MSSPSTDLGQLMTAYRPFSLMLMLVIGAFALVVSISSRTAHAQGVMVEPEDGVGEVFPEWAENPPHEPGVAFYGIGYAFNFDPELADDAKTLADKLAQNALGDELVGAAMSVFEALLYEKIDEDHQLAESTVYSFIQLRVQKFAATASIYKRESRQAGDATGYFALARVEFDAVAKVLHEAMIKAMKFAKVKANISLDEVKKQLKAVQDEGGTEPGEGGESEGPQAMPMPAQPAQPPVLPMPAQPVQPPQPAKPVIPDWVTNVPNEPGKAFYGVGTGTSADNAATGAKARLAADVAQKCEASVREFLKRANDGQLTDSLETTAKRLSKAAAAYAEKQGQIVKTETATAGGRDLYFALARVSYRDLLQVMRKELAMPETATDRVLRNADEAFAELERRLTEEAK